MLQNTWATESWVLTPNKEKLQGIKFMRNKEEYNIIKGGEKGVR